MIGLFTLSFGTVLSSSNYLLDVNTEETLDVEEEVSESNEYDSELKIKLLGSSVEEYSFSVDEVLSYVSQITAYTSYTVYAKKIPLFILFHSLKIDC